MNKHYLLDTNIISYLADANSIHREKIKKHFMKLKQDDVVSVSIVTLYELSYGLHSFKNTKQEVDIFNDGISFIKEYLDVIALNIDEVDIFGKLKAEYRTNTGISSKANKKNDLDFLIAATSINHNAILISNDEIFNKLIEINPTIKYENWLN